MWTHDPLRVVMMEDAQGACYIGVSKDAYQSCKLMADFEKLQHHPSTLAAARLNTLHPLLFLQFLLGLMGDNLTTMGTPKLVTLT